jgi:hypothetical protein
MALQAVRPKDVMTSMRNLIIDGAAGGETKRRHDVTFPNKWVILGHELTENNVRK